MREIQKIEVSIAETLNGSQVFIKADDVISNKVTFTRMRATTVTALPKEKIQIDDKRCPSIFGAIRNIELVYSPRS